MKNAIKGYIPGAVMKPIALAMAISGRILTEMGKPGYFEAIQNETTPSKEVIIQTLGGSFLHFAALPIIAFLLIEAFLASDSPIRFLLSFAGIAAVVELVTDLIVFGFDAFNGRYSFTDNPAFSSCSVYVTLLLGLLNVALMEKVLKKRFSELSVGFIGLGVLGVFATGTISIFLSSETMLVGVFIIVALYLYRDNPILRIVAVAFVQLFSLGASSAALFMGPIVGAVILLFYKKEDIYDSVALKIFVYTAYPLAYIVYAFITGNVGLLK